MKRVLISLLTLLFFITSKAQVSQIIQKDYAFNSYTKEFYNTNNPNYYSADFTKEDSYGNIIVGFNINDNSEENSEEINQSIIIKKYDPCYNEIWTVLIDPEDEVNYLLYDIVVSENNDVFFCGSATLTSHDGTRPVLGKVTESGNISWINYYGNVNTLNGGHPSIATGIAVSGDRAFVIGEYKHHSSGQILGFIAAFDGNGMLWDNLYDYNHIDPNGWTYFTDIDARNEIVAVVGNYKFGGPGAFAEYNGIAEFLDLDGATYASYILERDEFDYCTHQNVVIAGTNVIIGGNIEYSPYSLVSPSVRKTVITNFDLITNSTLYENEYDGEVSVELKTNNNGEIISSSTLKTTKILNVIYSTDITTGVLNWAITLNVNPSGTGNMDPVSIDLDSYNDIYVSGNYENTSNSYEYQYVYRLDDAGNVLNLDILSYNTVIYDALFQNNKASNKALLLHGESNPTNLASQEHGTIIYTYTQDNEEYCITGANEETEGKLAGNFTIKTEMIEVLNPQGEVIFATKNNIEEVHKFFRENYSPGLYILITRYNDGSVRKDKFIQN